MKVFLDYKFIFEPDNKISNLETFERALSEVFRQMGYKAENVRTVDDELYKVVFLAPLEITPDVSSPQPQTLSKVLNTMAKKRDISGKFKKQNG